MLKQFLHLGLMIGLGLGGGAPLPVVTTQRDPSLTQISPPNQAFPPGLQVLQADARHLVLALDVTEYVLTPTADLPGYHTLEVPGAEAVGAPGHPQLPAFTALIALPPTGQATLRLINTQPERLPETVRLAPAPTTEQTNAPTMFVENSDVPERPAVQTRLAPDPQAYAGAVNIPAQLAQWADEAWARDSRLMRLTLFPFQYNPAQGQLFWYRHLQVEITFPAVDQGQLATKPLAAEDGAGLTGVINLAQAEQWRAAQPPVVAPNFYAPPTTDPRFKIVVDKEGVYQLTYADLQAAGMDVANVDPRTFRLTNQSRVVAIEVSGEADGHLDPGDTVVFYGEAFKGDVLAQRYQAIPTQWNSYINAQRDDGSFFTWMPERAAQTFEQYTRDNVYWLTAGGTPSPRIPSLNSAPSGTAPIPTVYSATVRAENAVFWWNFHYTSLDTIFWDRVATGSTATRTYPMTLTAVAAGVYTAALTAQMIGDPYNLSAGPDHRTLLYMNFPTITTSALTNEFWEGRALHTTRATLPQTALHNGVNYLRFDMVAQPAVPNDQIFFDWFMVEYARLFQADNDQIRFSGAQAGQWQYHLDNFVTNTVRVYDVTQPLTPTRRTGLSLTASGGGFAADFELTHAANAQFIAVSVNGLLSPKSLSRYDPPDLGPTVGADYIIIAAPDFYTATQTLANYRAAQGRRVITMTLEDVLNEFNDGIYHPIAIRNLLAYAYANWSPPAPQYVALIGDGHWNFLGATRLNPLPPQFIPPNMAWVDPYYGEVDSANLLATIVGNDPIPDLHIGRLPARTDAELARVVNHIMAYEQTGFLPWQQRLVFVTDDTPDAAGDFVALSEDVIQAASPFYTVTRLYLDDYVDFGRCCLNTDLTKTINQTGTLLINYIGHGAVKNWAGGSALNATHVNALTNTTQLPFVLSMTCLDGYWYYGSARTDLGVDESLAEVMLRANANGGWVGSFSPTGWGVATGHDPLNKGFFVALFQDGLWTVGPAALRAKLNLYAAGHDYDLLQTFTIFGDPALRLRDPFNLTGAMGNPPAQAGAPGQTLTYTVQVTNTGLVTDAVKLTLVSSMWTTLGAALPLTLASGASGFVAIPLKIAANAPAFATDQAQVRVASAGDASSFFTVALTTNVNRVNGVALTPSSAAQSAAPGQWVTYTLTLTNTGNITDTFSLAASTSPTWTISFTPNSGALAMGTSRAMTVSVRVPSNALYLSSASALVTATSQMDPTRQAFGTLTTAAQQVRQLTAGPTISNRAGAPEAVLTHSFTLTNTGNYTDSFSLARLSGAWPITAPITLGPLGPGASASFDAQVTVPFLPAGQLDVTMLRLTPFGTTSPNVNLSLFSTAAQTYAFALSPTTSDRSGLPGQAVTHTLFLTNTGNYTDTFTFTVESTPWDTVIPASPVTIGMGVSAMVDVVVMVSPGALYSASVSAAITTTSQNPAVFAVARLTTTAELARGVTLNPTVSTINTQPLQTITHTVYLTNTGNFTDSFTIALVGGTWPITYPTAIGPLAAGAGQALSVVVEVPFVPDGQTEIKTLTATSDADPTKTSAIALVTAVNRAFGLTLGPSGSVVSGLPGRVVTHTFTVTNTGNFTDTFAFNVGPTAWTTWPPAPTAPLGIGQSASAQVLVWVASNALYQQAAGVVLTAASQSNLATVATAAITTTAELTRGVSVGPATSLRATLPGRVVTHTLYLTNTGNFTDTFNVSVSGGSWAVTYPTTLGPLTAHEVKPLVISVTVPAGTPDGQSQTMTLTAYSASDVNQVSFLMFQTQALWWRIFGPLIRR